MEGEPPTCSLISAVKRTSISVLVVKHSDGYSEAVPSKQCHH